MAVKSPLRGLLLSSLLVVGAVTGSAQTSLGDLVSQVKRAVVIVRTCDERGNTLMQATGFFIATDRVLTNLHGLDSTRSIQIKTFEGRTILAHSVIARYGDADLAILQLTQPAALGVPLQLGRVLQANGSTVVLDNASQSAWNVAINRADEGWSFEHTATHLQIVASLAQTNSGEPTIKLKGHVNGTAVTVPH